MIEQIQKTPAKVSIWQLLMESTRHRQALVKKLLEVDASNVFSLEDVYALIGNGKDPAEEEGHIKLVIRFSDADLPQDGNKHNRALFLIVRILDKQMPCIMVDDGSALNICPLKILPFLGLTEEALKRSQTIIRAYDNSKRAVIGSFETEDEVGEVKSLVEFTVIDIPVTFSLLLGRPWLHDLKAVSSTVHQKVIVPLDGKVVTLSSEGSAVVAAVGEMNEPTYGFQVAMVNAAGRGKVDELSSRYE